MLQLKHVISSISLSGKLRLLVEGWLVRLEKDCVNDALWPFATLKCVLNIASTCSECSLSSPLTPPAPITGDKEKLKDCFAQFYNAAIFRLNEARIEKDKSRKVGWDEVIWRHDMKTRQQRSVALALPFLVDRSRFLSVFDELYLPVLALLTGTLTVGRICNGWSRL